MAVWSSLASKYNQNIFVTKQLFNFLRNGLNGKGRAVIPVRQSHHETMPIRTSRFEYIQFKKMFGLYLMIGIIPIVLLVSYVNLFIGPAELALIPEGYEPKPWEYHKHPITRFFAKYLTPSPQELHERTLHTLFVQNEIYRLRLLEQKVKKLIEKRGDYQAWYYETPYTKYERRMIEDSEKMQEQSNITGKWIT